MCLIVQNMAGLPSAALSEFVKRPAEFLRRSVRAVRVVAVISAMAGVTDQLIKLAKACPRRRRQNASSIYCLPLVKNAAAALTAMAVNALGGTAISLTGAQAGILSRSPSHQGSDREHQSKQIHEMLSEDYIVIVAGFQGQTPHG